MSAPHSAGHIERSAGYEEQLAERATVVDVQARPLDTPPNFKQDLREFAELTLKRRALKDTLEGDKKRMDQLEERILAKFAEESISGIDLAGVGKVSLRKQLWAKVRRSGSEVSEQEKARAIQALKDAGLGEYVSEGYNTNTISALFREFDEQQGGLPPALEEAWEADRRYTLSVHAARS